MYWIAIEELRSKCQKKDHQSHPILFKIIRKISIYFTWLLIQTNCKPNTITIFGVIFGVMSGAMFYFGLVGAALTLGAVAVIADFTDGEVSRFHGTNSKEGTYLDSIHHFVVQPFFIAGVVFWGFESNRDSLFLGAGMVSVINSIVLPMSITASVDNAVLKHLLRYLNSGGQIISQKQRETIVSVGNTVQKKKIYRTVPGTIARLMDFPYVIIIMGSVVALNHYVKIPEFNSNGVNLKCAIYAYAFLSTAMICVFVWNVVHSRHIEKRIIEITVKY